MPRIARARSTFAAASLALVLASACGESDPTGTSVIPTDPTSAADTTAPRGRGTTIDPAALPRYAGRTMPAFYTAQVLQREDRGAAGNPITDAGATLGRVLFFDRRLSRNDSLSCANCHAQSLAFGDTARFSLGFERSGRTTAHAMRLANARFNESGQYFWDRRAASLQAQVIEPIQNPVEMASMQRTAVSPRRSPR
jgi:cytochrome c peroxidase